MFPLKIVIFHSYVSLPAGTHSETLAVVGRRTVLIAVQILHLVAAPVLMWDTQ